MVKNRKDKNGRMLNKGESQRKGGGYQFRYTDNSGKRQTIYASNLDELRCKEDELKMLRYSGIDYAAGKISVLELVQRNITLKQGVRQQTKDGYYYMLNQHLQDYLFKMQVGNIKISDIKQWVIQLQEEGYSYSTIAHLKSILNQAFQMAYEEDIIRKNPCNFKLANIISNNKNERFAMTAEQQRLWLDFIKNDSVYAKFYDQFVILLGTGLRISEFCGITCKDLDFEQQRIKIDHQLLYTNKKGYKIEKPKTEKGIRYIPMSKSVYTSLKNTLANRSKVKTEIIIDGYSNFVFLNTKRKPETRNSIERRIRRILAKYNSLHKEPMPNITPHVFRHTFCSNMANAGMDVNHLKYIMGHSKVTTTLDVYTHADYDKAATSMLKIVDFQ